MRVVSVKFKSANSKIYNSPVYYYNSPFMVEVGDEVIVDTEDSGLVVALVVEDDVKLDSCIDNNFKYLVQRVNTEEYRYYTNLATEASIMLDMMRNRIKEYQELTLIESLSYVDEELDDMLSSYKELMKKL